MKKLEQLLTLERMLNVYDNMNTKDAWITTPDTGENVECLRQHEYQGCLDY